MPGKRLESLRDDLFTIATINKAHETSYISPRCSHFSVFVFLGALMYLNEATLLNNIRIRYMKDAIYVSLYFSIEQNRQKILDCYLYLKDF